MARVFAYVVADDTGFAPNPHFGFCTLACCKPMIRRVADIGDYIVGFSPKAGGNKFIYAMKVCEKPTFTKYWEDKRFANKKADLFSQDPLLRVGDNIYEPQKDESGNAGYKQHPSQHSEADGSENPDLKAHDLKGERVLVASPTSFIYRPFFEVELPEGLQQAFFPLSRGHRSNFDDGVVLLFKTFFNDLLGRQGRLSLPMAAPPTAAPYGTP